MGVVDLTARGGHKPSLFAWRPSMTGPIIVRTVARMREHVRAWKADGQALDVV